MGFLSFSKYFMFIAFVFLDFIFLGDLRYMMIRIWVGFILLGLIEWVLLVMMLDSHAFMVVSHF